MATLFSQACQWNSGTQFVICGINNVGLEVCCLIRVSSRIRNSSQPFRDTVDGLYGGLLCYMKVHLTLRSMLGDPLPFDGNQKIHFTH